MKKYEWKNIINQNSPGRADCQVVTAINAYYILTGNIISRNSDTYEEFCTKCGCRYGAAINIDKIYKELGLKRTVKHYGIPWDVFNPNLKKEKYKKFLPLESLVWYKKSGFHSVAIIDYEPRTCSLRISGFRWETTSNGWIYWEDFQHYFRNKTEKKLVWNTQQIELRKKKKINKH